MDILPRHAEKCNQILVAAGMHPQAFREWQIVPYPTSPPDTILRNFKFQFVGMPPRATRDFGVYRIRHHRPIRYCGSSNFSLWGCPHEQLVTSVCTASGITARYDSAAFKSQFIALFESAQPATDNHCHCEPVLTLAWQSPLSLARTIQFTGDSTTGIPFGHHVGLSGLLGMTSWGRLFDKFQFIALLNAPKAFPSRGRWHGVSRDG